ncbi:MAG: hypothetical protein WCP85_04010 [Mariniphaga sp.]
MTIKSIHPNGISKDDFVSGMYRLCVSGRKKEDRYRKLFGFKNQDTKDPQV